MILNGSPSLRLLQVSGSFRPGAFLADKPALRIIPFPLPLLPGFSCVVILLGQREELLVDPFALIEVGVQVDLGSLDGGVSEVLLHHPEVL